jgi:uncharacterized membrane protein
MEILDMAVRVIGPVMMVVLFVMAWPTLRSWQ